MIRLRPDLDEKSLEIRDLCSISATAAIPGRGPSPGSSPTWKQVRNESVAYVSSGFGAAPVPDRASASTSQ